MARAWGSDSRYLRNRRSLGAELERLGLGAWGQG